MKIDRALLRGLLTAPGTKMNLIAYLFQPSQENLSTDYADLHRLLKMNCFFRFPDDCFRDFLHGATGRFSNPERMVGLLVLNRFDAKLIFSNKTNNLCKSVQSVAQGFWF